MKLLVLLLLVLIVLVLVWAAVTVGAGSRRRDERAGWRLHRAEEGTCSVFYLRRGATLHRIGAADRAHDDYDGELMAAQSEADDLRLRWNAAEKSLGE